MVLTAFFGPCLLVQNMANTVGRSRGCLLDNAFIGEGNYPLRVLFDRVQSVHICNVDSSINCSGLIRRVFRVVRMESVFLHSARVKFD